MSILRSFSSVGEERVILEVSCVLVCLAGLGFSLGSMVRMAVGSFSKEASFSARALVKESKFKKFILFSSI